MLTSLKSLLGYRLRAVDGHIGKVRDFHFDNEHWTLRHMAVSNSDMEFRFQITGLTMAAQRPVPQRPKPPEGQLRTEQKATN